MERLGGTDYAKTDRQENISEPLEARFAGAVFA
jgi:hypothetical protein